MLLEAIDAQLVTHKQERIHIEDELTIEHVYPQTPEVGVWKQLENEYLIHTMGNLTLLTNALNASISNGPFASKRTEITKQSRLYMNAYFQDLVGQTQWGETDIHTRGQHLFENALAIWPRPAQQVNIRLTSGQQRAIESLCTIAEQNGIGEPFRILLETGLRYGLYPRTSAASIMYAPQNNKNHALFTAWVTPKNNEMRVYVVTDSFPKFFKISNETAYQCLGASGWRTMATDGAEAFAQALDSLLGNDAGLIE
jgi:hypothetical protein